MTKITAANRSTRKSTKKSKAADVGVTQFDMTAIALLPQPNPGSEAAILDNLLGDLGAAGADDMGSEILEDADTEVVLADGPAIQEDAGEIIESAANAADESLLGDIEDDAAQIAARQAVYAAQQGTSTADDGSAPETPVEAMAPAAEDKAAKKAARDAERAKKKAEREAAKAAQPPKAPRPTSITHKPGDLLVAKMGSDWREHVVFSIAGSADTLVTEQAQNDFVERMNDREAIADKVREKIVMLLTWLKAGATADDLNEVMRRTFRVLHAKGELTSGDKGNLQLDLLAKPYSMGTARSQANQMFMALPELGLTVKEKGKMVPNPDSALLPAIYAKLGLQ